MPYCIPADIIIGGKVLNHRIFPLLYHSTGFFPLATCSCLYDSGQPAAK
ncbi:hypothetical protein HMPREF9436_00922 [Faecalibacterium cf. prausnitzii KLE1255]|uniref:Uncharacterized protein n=1 Tax=Faecalibacterium cf. prausnitzii KLE1255 TaxID=748224 RepID=E2ZGY5_9FIRM|nr:hypothetical protein HMPREF9436_00922 [Faecalibacterium cf. prausnitzii KLE1255]